jgi:hypothetical protein
LRTQERGISRKTIAQGKAGMLRLYLYARARLYAHLLHTRPRVQQAPGVPCALSWAKRYSTARASRRGNADAYHLGCLKCERDSLHVIARSASDDAIHLPSQRELPA